VKHWETRIALAILAWTAIGAVFALPSMLRGITPLGVMINWWMWGALVPLINKLDDRLLTAFKRPAPLLAAHAGVALLFPALYVAVASTLEYRLGVNNWDPWGRVGALFDWFIWAFIVYCIILGTLTGLKYYRRHLADELKLARLERRVLETRFNALRMQLDPQLLFDALSGISACVEHEPRRARKMIEHLGDLLRLSLATRNRQEVTLGEEISYLEHYFALQRMHFNDRLNVTLSVMPDVKHVAIPSLLLQPLVENAIRHGIAGRATGGCITVSARRVDGRVAIRVSDDGPGLPPDWQMSSAPGLGMRVTRERLLAMYPAGEWDFAVGRGADGGAEATISLPLEKSKQKNHHADAIA
jgi:two-component system, LytTR family, sensor kinase